MTADRAPLAFAVLSLALLAATGCSRPVAEEVVSETPVPVRTEAAASPILALKVSARLKLFSIVSMCLDLDFGWSPLPHQITGDVSTGNIAATLGYRFFLL